MENKTLVDLQDTSVQELFDLRASVEAELVRRGLSGAIGDIGERLAIEYFARDPRLPVLVAAPRGTKNVDAISRDGERYSIKTLVKARKTGTVYPNPENAAYPLFEYLLIVTLNDRCQLQSIHRLSWAVFLDLRKWDKRMNAWYVGRSDKTFSHAESIFEAGG